MSELRALLAQYSELPDWAELECRIDRPNNFGDFPINVAATRCELEELIILLNAGADINQIGEHGFTPLLNAVEQGCLNVVKFLIQSGADWRIPNAEGVTPLELAELLKEVEVATFLNTWIEKVSTS